MAQDNPAHQSDTAWRYGFLLFLLLLLAGNLAIFIGSRRDGYTGEPYGNLIISIMLLLNHVAFAFQLRTPWDRVMKVLAFAWITGGSIFIFSRVL